MKIKKIIVDQIPKEKEYCKFNYSCDDNYYCLATDKVCDERKCPLMTEKITSPNTFMPPEIYRERRILSVKNDII